MIRHFLIALQFLTRLPVPLHGDRSETEIGRSLLYYPWVGMVLGALLAASAWLLAEIPAVLRSALLLVIWVLLTGALHLDGLADSIDAWAGGRRERERTLALMKDPCSGPMGVTAVVLVLLVKFGALAILDTREPTAWMLAPFLGRAALPLLFLTTPYVRPDGLGAVLASGSRRATSVGIVALSYAIALIAAGFLGLWAVLSALAMFVCVRTSMYRRIGGTTGDTAGATVELTETAVLVGIAIAGSAG